jgi:hypothetical protein
MMQKRNLFTRVASFAVVIIAIAALAVSSGNALSPAPVKAQQPGTDTPHFSTKTVKTVNGKNLVEYKINGPIAPPSGYEAQRQAVDLPKTDAALSVITLTVPAYNWVFGCSSVSGSMIAAYYDRNGYANMYTGPTGGGVMPLNNSSWGTWSDGIDTYPNIPLAASHNGVDGRIIRGSIDDYWVSYGSSASDPYITGGWTQHAWGTAIGDYMKTSQSAYDNTDGSTGFYGWDSADQLTCADMESYGIQDLDGTYGRKLFYEARGYAVTTCYSQAIDTLYSGGFSFAQYKAEINAGRPVMINLEGHTIVGVGYDDATNTVYVHDTWDYSNHTMPWGGTYSGMQMLSVSIVNLGTGTPPGSFSKSTPTNGATGVSTAPTLYWGASSGATSYDYCYDTSNNSSCDGTWTNTTNTSAAISGLSNGTTYYWNVRAKNSGGTTNADSDTWWSFTTQVVAPGAFNKSAPANGATGVSPTTASLTWAASSGATSYDYCYDTSNDNACSNWINTSSTGASLPTLSLSTTYYWHVRAKNTVGTTYANASTTAFWSFTTGSTSLYYSFLPITKLSPPIFTGIVTDNGTRKGGIPLTLWFSSNGGSYNSYATTTTASDGSYVFANTPVLDDSSDGFVVEFYNSMKNTNWLYWFDCYTVTTSYQDYSCNINLHDIGLQSPGNHASVSPKNVKFVWTKRSTSTDSYKWYFYDWWYDYSYYPLTGLGYSNYFYMTFKNFEAHSYYQWWMGVDTPDGSGEGNAYRWLGFSSVYYGSAPLEGEGFAMDRAATTGGLSKQNVNGPHLNQQVPPAYEDTLGK